MTPPLRAPLIGRLGELAAARDALAAAGSGHGTLMLVHGEAGIGKTRLCEEIGATVDLQHTHVVRGRADPGDADTMCCALADSLRQARRSDPALWTAATRRRGLLGPVLPELIDGHRSAPTAVERPVLFETLLDVIEDAAGDRVTLWTLEDLQWADTSTWDFVVYLPRRVASMALVTMVTFRDDELPHQPRWRQRLPALRRDPNVVTLPLQRLDETETRLLIQALAPELSDATVDQIASRSAGTPLLTEELVAMTAGGRHAVPEVIDTAVHQRLAHASPDTRAVLDAVAVGGPRVDVSLLLDLVPIDPSAALDELVTAGLLVSAGDSGTDEVGFRHPLFWEAVYRGIPLARRRKLHARHAATLNETSSHQPERVARHYELADDPGAALRTLLDARLRSGSNIGRAASLSYAALEAARRHHRTNDRLPELTRAAIDDLVQAGRWIELEPLINTQWDRRHAADPAERAWLAGALVLDLFFLGAVRRARAVADEETSLADSGEPSEGASRLFAQAGYIAWCDGDAVGAVRLARRARQAADKIGDRRAATVATLVQISARYRVDHDRRRAIAEHRAAAQHADAANLAAVYARALYALATITTELEDLQAAERAAADAGIFVVLLCRITQALIHTIEGRPDQAESRLTRSDAALRQDVPHFAAAIDAINAHLQLHLGELDHARELLTGDSADTEPAQVPLWHAGHEGALGWVAWEHGHWDDANAHLARSLDSTLVSGYLGLETGPLMLPLHVDALVHLDRRDEATGVIELCTQKYPQPDRFFAAAVAAAQFRLHPSPATSVDAHTRAATAPWPWLDALIGCWRGELLGDIDAGRAALDLFDDIGARRGVKRAETVLRRLGAPVPRQRHSRGGLSTRELEIAGLVADGLSNTQIAAFLFVNRATVASHVTHILTKLDFSSRTQIATWFATRSAT